MDLGPRNRLAGALLDYLSPGTKAKLEKRVADNLRESDVSDGLRALLGLAAAAAPLLAMAAVAQSYGTSGHSGTLTYADGDTIIMPNVGAINSSGFVPL